VGDAFRVDLERLLALRPDAVLVWDSGTPVATIERLRSLHLRVEILRTQRLADIPQALRRIGEIAGTPGMADTAASQFERDMVQLREQYRGRAIVSVFVQVDDQPLYTVNGEQIISEIVELCGGRNIFADLKELAPAIGIEAVIAANPQVILSTDDTVPDPAAQWRRWRHIEATRTDNVYTMRSDDIARATTRLVAATREVCRTLDTARAKLAIASKQ
jgi:iron complex transport system substrate-binding protein